MIHQPGSTAPPKWISNERGEGEEGGGGNRFKISNRWIALWNQQPHRMMDDSIRTSAHSSSNNNNNNNNNGDETANQVGISIKSVGDGIKSTKATGRRQVKTMERCHAPVNRSIAATEIQSYLTVADWRGVALIRWGISHSFIKRMSITVNKGEEERGGKRRKEEERGDNRIRPENITTSFTTMTFNDDDNSFFFLPLLSLISTWKK